MTKKQKALIILLTPFIIGFLLGFLAGGSCCNKGIATASPHNDSKTSRNDGKNVTLNDGKVTPEGRNDGKLYEGVTTESRNDGKLYKGRNDGKNVTPKGRNDNKFYEAPDSRFYDSSGTVIADTLSSLQGETSSSLRGEAAAIPSSERSSSSLRGNEMTAAIPSSERSSPSLRGNEMTVAIPTPEPKQVIYHRNRLPYATLFNDKNDKHLRIAKEKGLKTVAKVGKQLDLNKLVKLKDNDYFVVDELRYSVPYLTKDAANQVNRIGKAFADSLQTKGFPKYRLIVSSVLRTEEDINRLRRSGNPNASTNSAHCYGTTFDITYTRYKAEDESEFIMQPFELTKVLGEVLLDQKKAGRILVKYESNEHCFHITHKAN